MATPRLAHPGPFNSWPKSHPPLRERRDASFSDGSIGRAEFAAMLLEDMAEQRKIIDLGGGRYRVEQARVRLERAEKRLAKFAPPDPPTPT